MSGLVSVGSICDRLHALAKKNGLRSLSMWLKMAANDAYLHDLTTEARSDPRIGIFDWDIPNDLDHVNSVGAEFFGKESRKAAQGLPVGDYLANVHPDDLEGLDLQIGHVVRLGGSFSAEYRVLADSRLRWLRADGTCTADEDGRPIRLMGSLVDVTADRPAHNVVPLRNR